MLALGVSMVTSGGFIEEIAQLPWRPAILVGWGGQEVVRELQKLFERGG